MSEHEAVAFAERFARYRTEVLAEVEPPGPAAVRRRVRQRRRRTLGTAVAAALALGTGPVVGYAALTDPAPPPGPVQPTGTPSGSPTPSTSAGSSASPTPTGAGSAPAAPNGRISRAQLLATPVSLPEWRPGSACPTRGARLVGEATRDGTNVLLGLAYGDVDRDGATETVALTQCLRGTGGPMQVVAFDRDPAGGIVTLGRVATTARETPQWITDVEVAPGGLVRVQVADLAPGGGWPLDWSQRQWRGYRWGDGRFTQVEGPTTFGPNPYFADLAVSATDLTLSTAEDGSRSGTVEVLVRHLRGREVTRAVLDLDLPGQLRLVGGSTACADDTGLRDAPLVCQLGPIAPGGEVRLRLELRVPPGSALAAGSARVSVVPHGPGGHHLIEPDRDNNTATINWR
ncbi:hypothetical protein ACWENR_18370 [Micromonospora sp. NPDC004336]